MAVTSLARTRPPTWPTTVTGRPTRYASPYNAIVQRGFREEWLAPHVWDTPCWIWQGAADGNGYGVIWFQGRIRTVHRVVYEAQVGPLPAGHQVRHRCDVPLCGNPDHLVAGTHQDNMNDLKTRPRTRKPRRRLTAPEVRRMRAEHAAGMTAKAIAARYDMDYRGIRRILKRQSWRDV